MTTLQPDEKRLGGRWLVVALILVGVIATVATIFLGLRLQPLVGTDTGTPATDSSSQRGTSNVPPELLPPHATPTPGTSPARS